jgi:hypothetical protein
MEWWPGTFFLLFSFARGCGTSWSGGEERFLFLLFILFSHGITNHGPGQANNTTLGRAGCVKERVKNGRTGEGEMAQKSSLGSLEKKILTWG